MTGASLRIVSSRSPYRRAGLTFEAPAGKTIAVVVVPLAVLDDDRIEQLLADPHLDVMTIDGPTVVSDAELDRLIAERLALDAGRPDDDLADGDAKPAAPAAAAPVAPAPRTPRKRAPKAKGKPPAP